MARTKLKFVDSDPIEEPKVPSDQLTQIPQYTGHHLVKVICGDPNLSIFADEHVGPFSHYFERMLSSNIGSLPLSYIGNELVYYGQDGVNAN